MEEALHALELARRGYAVTGVDRVAGFVERLLDRLTSKGFHVYLTADHGNVEAVGQGRPRQGVAAEMRGERVRTYRSEALAAESAGCTRSAAGPEARTPSIRCGAG